MAARRPQQPETTGKARRSRNNIFCPIIGIGRKITRYLLNDINRYPHVIAVSLPLWHAVPGFSATPATASRSYLVGFCSMDGSTGCHFPSLSSHAKRV